MVRQIAMKFDTKTHFDPLNPIGLQNFEILKSKMADGSHFHKSKNAHICAMA